MAKRRINLLPSDLAAGRRARRRVFAVGAAGLVLVGVLGIAYAIQTVRLRNEEDRVDAQEERNAGLRSEIAALQEFAQLDAELTGKLEIMDGLTKDEVRWSVLLSNVSLVIPSDVWLTNLTGNVVPSSGEGDGDVAPVLGQMAMNGTTFTHVDVSKWLTRLGAVDEFTFPYLSLSSKSTIGTNEVVTFNSTIQLSEDAFRRSQRGSERQV